ncbi:MAG: endonuclease III domain-containing protein [Isosphaeraceae bacterium]
MPSLDESYAQLVAALANFYGEPALPAAEDSPFAAVLLPALDRDAVGKDGDPLLAALDRAGLLEPEALAAAAPEEVRDTLEQAGIKLSAQAALLVVRLARWYAATFPEGADPADQSATSTSTLRKQLAGIRGVGQATSQAILLALGHPVYPLDRGTYRILVRHDWADCFTEPDEISQHLGRLAGDDCREIMRLSRWLSRVGRQFCGPTTPKCDRCPLSGLLPENGPLEPESG